MTPYQISAALRSRFAAVAGVAIVGCAIGANVAPTPAAAHARVANTGVVPLTGEVLIANNVRVSCALRGAGFTASGEAAGPYRGAFTAYGRWGFGLGFSESFTITPRTGVIPISGTITVPDSVLRLNCESYPGAIGAYRSGHLSGSAATDMIKDGMPFVQEFH